MNDRNRVLSRVRKCSSAIYEIIHLGKYDFSFCGGKGGGKLRTHDIVIGKFWVEDFKVGVVDVFEDCGKCGGQRIRSGGGEERKHAVLTDRRCFRLQGRSVVKGRAPSLAHSIIREQCERSLGLT